MDRWDWDADTVEDLDRLLPLEHPAVGVAPMRAARPLPGGRRQPRNMPPSRDRGGHLNEHDRRGAEPW